MASVAVRRSPVFTPSPSDSHKVMRTLQQPPPPSASRTPQRRRSLQSTRTMVGSASPVGRDSRRDGGISGVSVDAEPTNLRSGTPIMPSRCGRAAWGAVVTPPRLSQHPAAQTSQSLAQPEPEPELEPSQPESQPELQPESKPKPKPMPTQVQRNPVMPALRPVSAPNAPARARFSGLDTRFSSTWPWQDGVNTAWSQLETQLIAAVAACLKPRDVVRAAGTCCSWRRVILRRCQIDTAWAAMFTEKFGRLPRDCVGTSAAQQKFLETESTLRSAFRTRKLTMSVRIAAVGGWIYSTSCGAGFVLAGSLCGAAAIVNTRTGKLYKRLDGHRPTPPGQVGTDCDPSVTGVHPPAHHEQFYCCAVAAAASLYGNDNLDRSDIQVVLGSNHALRFVRLAACDNITVNNLDESEEEPEPEDAEVSEAQLSFDQFTWLVRRQCRITDSECPDNALRQLFDYVDQDRSGCISGSEFAEFLRQDTIKTYSVFDTAMAHIEAEFDSAKGYSVHAAFQAIDQDGSGALDVDELEAALSLLGLKLSRAEVLIVLAGLDEDGNGEISASEFSKGMKIARRKSKQRKKLEETKKRVAEKCKHTGDERIESPEELKMNELIATAFLRLYERLERKPQDATGHSVNVGSAHSRAAPRRQDSAANKQNQPASVMQSFRELDEDGSGSLNARELRAAFAKLGVVLTRPALAEVMSELDADGSGTVDMAELLDRAFVARLEAVRRRLISSAVLMSSTSDEWAGLFDRYAKGQKDTMEGPADPEKIEKLVQNFGRNSESASKGGVYNSPNVVATSEEHGWVTHVALVGHGGSPGSKQWRAAETVAVAYQDGTVESWSITKRLRTWTIPRAHSSDGSGEKAIVGLVVIGKGDSRLEEISPAAIGQPPVFENAIVASAGRWDGIQLREPLSGQCLRIIDTSATLGCTLFDLKPSPVSVETTAVCTFRRTVVCGATDGLIRAWSPEGMLKFTLLPDRTLLPVSRGRTCPSFTASDKSTAEPSAQGPGEVGRIVCLAANGDRIAAVDAYGTLRIWEPTCFTDHIPLPGDNTEDTPQARAKQRYFSPALADATSATAMVTPQFTAVHGEPGWLAHPIWSLSWDGPSKLWCGLESGQLAALDFSEEAAKTAPAVFRPVPKKHPSKGNDSLRSKRAMQRRRTIDRLARPSPRWATPRYDGPVAKVDKFLGSVD
jgi:centrin-1